MIYNNVVDLYYYKDTGEITPLFKGKRRNYRTIRKFSKWTTYHNKDEYYFINDKGYRVEIDDKTMEWFEKE